MRAGLPAHRKIQPYRAVNLHIILAPALRHSRKLLRIHHRLYLWVYRLGAAYAGRVQPPKAYAFHRDGGVFQYLGLLCEVGEGVHAPVRNCHEPVSRRLIKHHMAYQPFGAYAVFLIQYSTHKVSSIQYSLHKQICPAAAHCADGLCGTIRIAVSRNKLKAAVLLAQFTEYALYPYYISHQYGICDILSFCLANRLQYLLIVRRGYRYYSGSHARRRPYKAFYGDHINIS